MKKYITIIMHVIVLTGCNLNSSDSKKLGKGYVYWEAGSLSYIFSNLYNGPKIYPTIIEYANSDRYVFVKQKANKNEITVNLTFEIGVRFTIYNNVLDGSLPIDNNDPLSEESIKSDSLIYKLLKSKGVTSKNTIDDNKICSSIADSLLGTEPYRKMFVHNLNYWIIDKTENRLMGPFTLDEFNIKLKNLGIRSVRLN